MQLYCTSERHEGAAEGVCYLSRAEDVMAELLTSRRNSVQLIYLDPPSAERDSLRVRSETLP